MSVDTPEENTVGIVTTTAIGKACVKATQPTAISGAAVYEDKLMLKLGKRTYIEQKLHELGIG